MLSSKDTTARRLILLSPLVFIGLLGYYMLLGMVNVPVWDQWHFATILDHYFQGTLQAKEFYASHNGHRLVFPRLAMLGMALLSDWNINWEIYLNFILGLCIYIAFYFLFKFALKPETTAETLVYPCIAIFVFSLKQSQNWYWGWQMALFLCSFMSVLCLLLLCYCSDKKLGMLLALLCAWIASYSFANGLMIWPVGFIVLILKNNSVNKVALLWLALALLCFASYFIDSPVKSSSQTLAALDYLTYLSAYLGSPLVSAASSSSIGVALVGAGLASSLLFMFYRQQQPFPKQVLPFIGCLLFGLLSATLTSIARMHYGIDQALDSRYTTFSLFFWLGLIGLIFYNLKYTFKPGNGSLNIYAVALVFIVFSGLKASWDHRIDFEDRGKILSLYSQDLRKDVSLNNQNPRLDLFSPDRDFTIQQTLILKKYNLSLFKEH